MTFRINFVQHDGDQWFFDIARSDEKHSSLALYTDSEGRGLTSEDSGGSLELVLPDDEFRINRASGKDAAAARVANALEALGWGPAIDRYGALARLGNRRQWLR